MPSATCLPFELEQLLLTQLSTLELCESLFPLTNELTLAPTTALVLPSLRPFLTASTLPASISFTLLLSLPPPPDEPPYEITLSITLPLSSPPTPLLTLHQPSWLSRAAHTELSEALAASATGTIEGTELVLDAVEWLRENAPAYFPLRQVEVEAVEDEELVRAWYWFPSLSTRQKRDDIVNWAPEWGITGFVLAGKPALLCLEGTPTKIDAYMGDIKSVSWADIPSFQKKVSERHRETLGGAGERVFGGMEEITHLVGKGGARGNRGEMGDVRDWLGAKGLGEAFGIVVGGGTF